MSQSDEMLAYKQELQALYDATTHLISEIASGTLGQGVPKDPCLRRAYLDVTGLRHQLRQRERIRHNEDFWLKARKEGVR
jgi:hypothetical protein